jgi:ferrous iron transport protein B
MSKDFVVALVGNPNCGKTTLFNALTGARQKVGNWPGVTVERKSGFVKHADQNLEIVDLPGTYALHVGNQHESLDEQIAQNYVLSGQPDLLLNIIDASSLERGLYLTSQLLDAGIPMVIALNMMDVADSRGVHIDPHALTETFGFPFVPIIASKNEGIGSMLDAISTMVSKPRCQVAPVTFPPLIENTIAQLQNLIASANEQKNDDISYRMLSTALLERDSQASKQLPQSIKEQTDELIEATEQQFDQPLSDVLTTSRYDWINRIVKDAVTNSHQDKKTLTDYIDDIVLNRYLALPLFLFVMYLMFMFTINLGSAFIDFFDIIAGGLFIDLPKQWLNSIGCPVWLSTLLADGLGGGIQLVATFIPIIGCLFLFLSFLEDSGYMARAAFIIDRIMRSIGLPGKSFVPLIVGFGCNVPSIMAARTLENQNDRLLTTIMAPFMSCGARLTVYALFAAAFFPVHGQNVVFGLYLIGIFLAVLSAFIIRRFIMTGAQSAFIIELPAYHMPTIKGLIILTWQRLRGFIVRAGKAIVVVVVILNFVNSIGSDGSFGNENTDHSMLSVIGKAITPAFEPMGVKADNWPATVGIFTGMFAKEVVVGTLDTLYSSMIETNKQEDDVELSISAIFYAGWSTIPENLGALISNLSDPLGINIGDVSNVEAAASEQAVQVSTLSIMQTLFSGQLGAFAYLLFILLYIPCVATLGAIYKEQGAFWMWFTVLWSTTMAYALAVIVFQIGSFALHPLSSLLWIGGMLGMIIVSYSILLSFGKKRINNYDLIPAVNL